MGILNWRSRIVPYVYLRLDVKLSGTRALYILCAALHLPTFVCCLSRAWPSEEWSQALCQNWRNWYSDGISVLGIIGALTLDTEAANVLVVTARPLQRRLAWDMFRYS